MVDKQRIHAQAERLTDIRSELFGHFPFFGRLLLRLRFGFAECGTAFTDMRQIVFDPDFAEWLDREEITFVLMHELFHCVLHHCTRGHDLIPIVYNIACDIVVNSFILDMMNRTEFRVDGCEIMHLAPDGVEGREYTAETVYDMLINAKSIEELKNTFGKNAVDVHSVWGSITAQAADAWDSYVKQAAQMGAGAPGGLERRLAVISHEPKVNWRQLLHDFIRHNMGDYTYLRPDRRFQDGIIMPSYVDDITGESVEDIWVVIDTSASVSDEKLAEAFQEVRSAVLQLDGIRGELSFFDAAVTDPVPFETVEDLDRIKPVGGGGTSFVNIFKYLDEHMRPSLPRAVIIITDGEAWYPDEKMALDTPVLWIIIDGSGDPPWGTFVHID